MSRVIAPVVSNGHEGVTRDCLQRDVQALALPRGRMVGSAGHALVRAYLDCRLAVLGLRPYRGHGFELPYRVPGAPGVEFCNVVGVVPGGDRGLAPVLIGAHYDSVIAAPCADDNAAAVAIALSAAAALVAEPCERDVVIALFDAEEPPYFLDPAMGSIRFCEDQADDRGIHAAIVMDLVGHEFAVPMPGLANLLIATGIETSGALPALVDGCPRPLELPLVVAPTAVVGDESDYSAFRMRGVPFLFLTSGRWPHYHQPTDTVDRLAWGKMRLVGDYVVALTRALARTDLGVAPVDTIAMEIRHAESALGARLPEVLVLLGISRLRTRRDLDALAAGFKMLGV